MVSMIERETVAKKFPPLGNQPSFVTYFFRSYYSLANLNSLLLLTWTLALMQSP